MREGAALVNLEKGREGLFGVIQGTISIVEDADAIPELGVFLIMRSRVMRGMAKGRIREEQTLGLGRK